MDGFDPVRRLAELRAARDRISSNLLELERDPTVAMLEAADLHGVTAARWSTARETLAHLFTDLSELRRVIDRGEQLCGRGWLLSGPRLDELNSLLAGPSIVVADTTRRLSERDLLSESRVVVRESVDELIHDMSVKYDDVKALVVAVSRIWDDVIPRLRSERQRSLDLLALAAEFDLDQVEIEIAELALRDLSELVLTDPLGVDAARLDDVSSLFDRVEHDLAGVRELRDRRPEAIAGARALLADAEAAVRTCEQVVLRVNSRIVLVDPFDIVTLPVDAGETLDRIAQPTAHNEAARALVAWREVMTRRLSEAKEASKRAESLLTERDELRARLDAFAAKSDRLGLLEDAAVSSAYEEARAVLYTAPTDLGRAHAAVNRYGALLTERSGS